MRNLGWRLAWVLAVPGLLAGCGSDTPTFAPLVVAQDAAVAIDVGNLDSAGSDAGSDAAGLTDGGAKDSGSADGGGGGKDTALADADGGAGKPDAALPDANGDGGSPDVAPTCEPTDPPTEVCDGIDNDCDGAADNVDQICEDGNACTDASCDGVNGCISSANSAPCDDGNACTLADLCVAGACKAGKLDLCSDGNPCTSDSCENGKTGCQHWIIAGCAGCKLPADCDDGDTCTTDSCDAATGKCSSTKILGCAPGCKSHAACDDKDKCTFDTCNLATGKCEIKPVAGCLPPCAADADCDDQNVCTDDACNASTGSCSHTSKGSLLSPVACDDGDLCTTEQCASGKCLAKPKTCNDGDSCTKDSCDAQSGLCAYEPIAGCASKCKSDAECNDLDACTKDFCDGFSGQCKTAPIAGCTPKCKSDAECNDQDACTKDFCDGFSGQCKTTPIAGCTPKCKSDAECNDQDDCTKDFCDGFSGQCKTTPIAGCTPKCKSDIECADQDVCTADKCDLMTGACSNSKIAGCGGLADLTVTAVSTDKLAYAVGETGAVSVTVVNAGQKASGVSSALVALNINALLSGPYDPVANPTGYVGLTVAIKALAPGESVTVKESFVVPDFLGKFYLFGVADLDKQVEESNENNNQLKASAQVSIASAASLKPDLTVTAISADKTSYIAGETGNVTITVKNSGQQAAGPSSALAALSLTAVLGAPYDPVTNPGGYGAMAIAIKGLAPGESVTVKQSFTVPDLPATYYLIGLADADKQVDEANENNNEFKAAQQVTIASAPVLKPDLTVTAISADKTSYIVGELGNVTITVKNAGQKASAPSNALAALSPTAVLGTPYDPVSNPSGYGAMTIPIKGLAPGESVTVKQSFTVPDLPAIYYLIGVADTDKLIDESNENNNQFKAAQQVSIASGPDLVPIEVKLSQTSLVAEDAATAYVTVKNAGGSPSPKTTVVAALAFNTVLTKPYDPNTNPKGDAMLAIDVAALAPGQSVQVAANFVVPNLPGSYYLIARADYNQVVAESKEDNNELLASGKITIAPPKPDLVVYGLTFSTSSLVPGANATVSATVKNNGKGASGPSEVIAALGRKPALGTLYDPVTNPTGDLALLMAVKALAPGEAVQVSSSFVVPDVPAAYFGLAMADYKNAVAESVESNNTHTAPGQYTILSKPDLVASNLSMPTALYQGKQATASCTISNYGGLSAAPTKVLFVLAKTATLASPYDWLSNPNGYLAAEGTVGALSGGQSSPSSITFTVPPLPGSYYFFVLSDYGNTVGESNESNNTATWSTKVTIY